jgi:hypothetical protein
VLREVRTLLIYLSCDASPLEQANHAGSQRQRNGGGGFWCSRPGGCIADRQDVLDGTIVNLSTTSSTSSTIPISAPHQLYEFSSIRALNADAGNIAGKRRPEWRPQSAVSNRRSAAGATGAEGSLLTTTSYPAFTEHARTEPPGRPTRSHRTPLSQNRLGQPREPSRSNESGRH